ncbi:hypothetical protein I8F96_13985 [Enterococcus casseliflavus]|nr:hypothetical protein [Enterococcus casseliflavus]
MKWYLPLQDKFLVRSLYNLETSDKLNKKRYKELISQLANEFEIFISTKESEKSKFKSLLKKKLLRPYQYVYFKLEIINHQFEWFGLFKSREILYYLFKNGRGFPAIISKVYVDFLESKYEKIKNSIITLMKTGFFHIFTGNILIKAVSFISSFLVVRILTKDEYAYFAYADNLYAYIILFPELVCLLLF